MPEVEWNEANVRHLLRRTEFVDRPERIDQLLAAGSVEAAVGDVLSLPEATSPITFTEPASRNWQRGVEMTHVWLDRMAHDAPRPFHEKLAFFWHGHFCSDFGKVGLADLMREQIDLWRLEGLGNVGSLARTMSTQVAMLRYLDNNQNRGDRPNQNFARELMELFLLGVGNYAEADVEAATAAWSGHSDQWDDEVSPYRWRGDWHDGRPKMFLGRTINSGGDPRDHGYETIDVILGSGERGGMVPTDASAVANRGRPTRDVAAEFLSRKLWTWFATDRPPPTGVLTVMRSALLDSDFDVGPWVRAMLTHPDFYSPSVRSGAVRTPVEYVVALLHATGRRADDVNITWLMESMGQRPLFPPNVSGWRPNGYWVNASAMEGRARVAQSFAWASSRTYWDGGALLLGEGRITNAEITARNGTTPVLSSADLVDRLAELMGLSLGADTRSEIIRYADGATVWERNDALLLLLLAPEMHLA